MISCVSFQLMAMQDSNKKQKTEQALTNSSEVQPVAQYAGVEELAQAQIDRNIFLKGLEEKRKKALDARLIKSTDDILPFDEEDAKFFRMLPQQLQNDISEFYRYQDIDAMMNLADEVQENKEEKKETSMHQSAAKHDDEEKKREKEAEAKRVHDVARAAAARMLPKRKLQEPREHDPYLGQLQLPTVIEDLIKEYYISREPIEYSPVAYEMMELEDPREYCESIEINPRGTVLIDDCLYNSHYKFKAEIIKASTDRIAALREDDSCIVAIRQSQYRDAEMHHADGSFNKILKGHTESITSIIAKKDGTIMTGSKDATIRVWSNDGDLQKILEAGAHVTCLAFGKDESLVCGRIDGICRAWDQALSKSNDLLHKDIIKPVRSIFTRDDRSMIVEYGLLNKYEKGSDERAIVDAVVVWKIDGSNELIFQEHQIVSVDVNHNGALVAVCSDKVIRILNPDGSLRKEIENIPKDIFMVKMNPQGVIAALRDWDSELFRAHVWNLDYDTAYEIPPDYKNSGIEYANLIGWGPNSSIIIAGSPRSCWKPDLEAVEELRKLSVWQLKELHDLLIELKAMREKHRDGNFCKERYILNQEYHKQKIAWLPECLQDKLDQYFDYYYYPEDIIFNDADCYSDESRKKWEHAQKLCSKLSHAKRNSLRLFIRLIQNIRTHQLEKLDEQDRDYDDYHSIPRLLLTPDLAQLADDMQLPKILLERLFDHFNLMSIEQFGERCISSHGPEGRVKVHEDFVNALSLLSSEELELVRHAISEIEQYHRDMGWLFSQESQRKSVIDQCIQQLPPSIQKFIVKTEKGYIFC